MRLPKVNINIATIIYRIRRALYWLYVLIRSILTLNVSDAISMLETLLEGPPHQEPNSSPLTVNGIVTDRHLFHLDLLRFEPSLRKLSNSGHYYLGRNQPLLAKDCLMRVIGAAHGCPRASDVFLDRHWLHKLHPMFIKHVCWQPALEKIKKWYKRTPPPTKEQMKNATVRQVIMETAPRPKQKICYAYKRDVYNDGMVLFCWPVFAKEADSESEHIMVTIACYNLGIYHLSEKRYLDAANWFARARTHALGGPKAIFQNSSLHACSVLHHMGFAHYNLGNYYASTECYRKAMELAKIHFPPITYALTMNSYAVNQFRASTKKERLPECRDLLERTLAIFRNKKPGSESITRSVYLSTVLNNLGRVYHEVGELEKAMDCFKEALTDREGRVDKVPPGHTLNSLGIFRWSMTTSMDVAITLLEIGKVHNSMKDYDKAIEHYHKFLELAEPVVGKNHPDIVIAYTCLAIAHENKNEYFLALDYVRVAFAAALKVYPKYNFMVRSLRNRLAQLAKTVGRLEEALGHRQELLRAYQAVFKKDHDYILDAMQKVARLQLELGNSTGAFLTFRELRDAELRRFGSRSLKLAKTLDEMGWICIDQGDYVGCLDFFWSSLAIHRQHFGKNHHDLPLCLANIGIALTHRGDFRGALRSMYEALEILINLVGKQHSDVAYVWQQLGTTYYKGGNDPMSLECLKESLRVRLVVGDDLRTTYQELGHAYRYCGDYNESLHYYKLLLRLHLAACGTNVDCVVRVLKWIAELHLKESRIDLFMQFMCEAERINRRIGNQCVLDIEGLEVYPVYRLHPKCASLA